jgi:DNA-binding SARP family transcriptional activator
LDEFRLLGPLEVVVDGAPLRLAAGKPRALLAFLLLNANRVVATEALTDALWGDEPPERATKTLQVYVSQLRKELGPDRLVTRPPGYELRVEESELDLDRFTALAAQARERLAAGDASAAARGFRDALGLWRGPPLREFRDEPFAQREGARLDDLRLGTLEDRLHAELDAGATAAVVPELEQLVASEPLRERPRELLMLALYRAGRQADALDVYRRARELFVDELGIEPGPALRELEQAILRQDDSLATPARDHRQRQEPAAVVPQRRRLVLVAVAVLALVAAAVVAIVLTTRDEHPRPRENPDLRVFVYTLENFLVQSRAGRAEVRHALAAALSCAIPARTAAARLGEVQANRQSLLEQLAALRVPAGRAPHVADLLQKATHASMEADAVYRNWLRRQTGCARGAPPRAAQAADTRATSLKRAFVTAFDPLAKTFRQRAWKADEF